MSKILLVEDDKILLKMYQDKLENEGYQVIVAIDGREGLKKVEEEKPDFILLDLMMPKLSGVEVLKILKSNGDTRDIPVAILSVIPEEDTIWESNTHLLDQIVAYFRKDQIEPSEIVEVVKKYLENKIYG